MIYNEKGFLYLAIFVIIIIVSIVLQRYKSVNIKLPYKNGIGTLSIIRYILIFFIFTIIVTIPFNIGIYQGTYIKKVPSLNVEILFDVSLSMTAKDFKPDRFTVAKNSLIDFLKELNNQYNIGLITFSGKPFIYSPITDNKKALIYKIQNMKMSDFPPLIKDKNGFNFAGTAIGDALLLGTRQLIDYSKKEKPGVIILFTDGDNNQGIKIFDALKIVKKYKIPVFVGAIGTRNYIIGQDIYGKDVDTKIDYKKLEKIAEETNGKFKKIEKKEDFKQILSSLYKYIKNTEQIQKINKYLYINYYLKRILLFLLITYGILFVRFKVKSVK